MMLTVVIKKLLSTKSLFGGIEVEGKLTKYFKYRKINKYLKLKDKSQYNCLDNIFKYYVDGDLKKLLDDYGFTLIEIFPEISNDANTLQICFRYINLFVGIDLADECYDYVVYLPDISTEEFDKSFTTKQYINDFNIENFFEDFYNMLQKDSRLRK